MLLLACITGKSPQNKAICRGCSRR